MLSTKSQTNNCLQMVNSFYSIIQIIIKMEQQEINQYKPYLQLAQSIQEINPVLAYYAKTYAAQKAHAIFRQQQANPSYKIIKPLGQQINSWVSELEATKKGSPQLFESKEKNQADITNFILQFFLEIDTRERDVFSNNLLIKQGEVSKELMGSFQICSKYFDVMQYFGPLSPDMTEKSRQRKYAKLKAVEQMKKMKNPELYQKPKEQDAFDQFDKELQAINQKVENQAEPPKVIPQLSSNFKPGIQSQAPQQPVYGNKQDGFTQPQPQQPQPYNYPQNIQSTQQPSNYNQQPQFPNTGQQFPVPTQQPSNYNPPKPNVNIPAQNSQQYQQPSHPQQPQPQVSQPGDKTRINNAMVQAEKRANAKKFLENAISELDFKKYDKAKENLAKAMSLVDELQNS